MVRHSCLDVQRALKRSYRRPSARLHLAKMPTSINILGPWHPNQSILEPIRLNGRANLYTYIGPMAPKSIHFDNFLSFSLIFFHFLSVPLIFYHFLSFPFMHPRRLTNHSESPSLRRTIPLPPWAPRHQSMVPIRLFDSYKYIGTILWPTWTKSCHAEPVLTFA